MRLSKVFLAALFIGSIAFAAPAFADSVKLIGTSGSVVGGVYVAPYQLQDSSIQGGATINVVCDDYYNDVVPGETWKATTEMFSSNGSISGALFSGQPNSKTSYDTAIYLYAEYLSGKADAAGMNYAIWGIFDPSVVNTSAYKSTDAATLLSAVTTLDLTSFQYYSSYGLITPTGLGSIGTEPQEYIFTTPEPSALLLLASGLFALAFLKRKSFQVNANALRHS
jgi:PEP-CTERM motif